MAAIFAYHYAAPPVDRAELGRITDHMRARGPDGRGVWHGADGRVGLGHRRLAVVGPGEAGAQPMHSRDGRYVLSFNGEVYNHAALRRELERDGLRPRSRCDTEILLELLAAHGEAALGRLRGMFAFVLWDRVGERLLLGRDALGVKPLYYADDGWTVRVASQVRALVEAGRVSRATDPAGMAGFYLFGSVPEPFTTHAGVRSVPAGSVVVVDAVGCAPPRRWYCPATALRDALAASPAPTPAADTVRDAVVDSVRHHLVADVPVAVLLSSGVDSGALLGVAAALAPAGLRAVTVAFDEFSGAAADEAPLAAAVARRYGVAHDVRRVPEEEFRRDLPDLLGAMDQPSIDGVNAWFAAKAVAEAGYKVAISGLGGDELFAGYPSFATLPRLVRGLALPARVPGLGAVARRLATPLLARTAASPKAAGLLRYGGTWGGAYLLRRGLFMPWELPAIMGPRAAREGLRRLQPVAHAGAVLRPDPGNDVARVTLLESCLYLRNQLLRDADWAGMAHSVEVRPPLVDATLLARVAPVVAATPPGEAKRLLAGCPRPPLPALVAARPKTGFTTPMEQWLGRAAAPGARRAARPSRLPHWSRRWAFRIAEGWGPAG